MIQKMLGLEARIEAIGHGDSIASIKQIHEEISTENLSMAEQTYLRELMLYKLINILEPLNV